MRAMQRLSDEIIADFGGLSALAEIVEAPVSTVHSWRRKGLSKSRLAHLRLAAVAHGKTVRWDTLLPIERAAA